MDQASISKARPFRPHRFRRMCSWVALAAVAALTFVVGGTSPASAAVCQTAGHAYLTRSGSVFFSGFEGNQQFGVPTVQTFQVDRFGFGGNGIRPLDPVIFDVINKATGAPAPIFSGVSTFAVAAGRNCVANEQFLTMAAAPGTYQVRATYVAGNSVTFVANEPVADIVVRPTPDPDPDPDPNPCNPRDPCPLTQRAT